MPLILESKFRKVRPKFTPAFPVILINSFPEFRKQRESYTVVLILVIIDDAILVHINYRRKHELCFVLEITDIGNF